MEDKSLNRKTSRLSQRQRDTIARMKQTRIDDSIALRKSIEQKLEWAKAEKTKGLAVIEKQMQQIKENKDILMKLSAVIDVLTDLLNTKSENPEEAKQE